jgi:hypothetical protein
VLTNDAQTMGGYPKIALVAEADRWRLAHLTPGATVRFALLTRPEEAWQALMARWQQWQATLAAVRTAPADEPLALFSQPHSTERAPDTAQLLSGNLVSGVWNAWEEIL